MEAPAVVIRLCGAPAWYRLSRWMGLRRQIYIRCKVSPRFRPLYKPFKHTSSARAWPDTPYPTKGDLRRLYSYLPVLRPEHAGLALEVLCLSALGIADVVIRLCFGVRHCGSTRTYCLLLCSIPCIPRCSARGNKQYFCQHGHCIMMLLLRCTWCTVALLVITAALYTLVPRYSWKLPVLLYVPGVYDVPGTAVHVVPLLLCVLSSH